MQQSLSKSVRKAIAEVGIVHPFHLMLHSDLHVSVRDYYECGNSKRLFCTMCGLSVSLVLDGIVNKQNIQFWANGCLNIL
jgi:hypothetical protein